MTSEPQDVVDPAEGADADPAPVSGTDSSAESPTAVDASGERPAGEGERNGRTERLEKEGDVAADYLEELLDVVDLDGDLEIGVEGDRAVVSIVGEGLDHLAGRDGDVLEALQELTRLAVHRETGERSRLMLDVAGHRAERRSSLVALAEKEIESVRSSGTPVSLDPMTAFERKVVHDAVSAAGLVSESEGAEPRRHVVILPA